MRAARAARVAAFAKDAIRSRHRAHQRFGESHPELVVSEDANTLRFNHKLHLAPKGVFNATGKREVLQCTTCHELVDRRDKADPTPIDFAQHCQRCHRLTFDDALPDDEVPHGGDNGIVYGYVVATYSGDRDIVGKPRRGGAAHPHRPQAVSVGRSGPISGTEQSSRPSAAYATRSSRAATGSP